MKNKYFVKPEGRWYSALIVVITSKGEYVIDQHLDTPGFPNFRRLANYTPENWKSLTYTEAKAYLKNWDGRDLDASLRAIKRLAIKKLNS
jgi:hypothetical protein